MRKQKETTVLRSKEEGSNMALPVILPSVAPFVPAAVPTPVAPPSPAELQAANAAHLAYLETALSTAMGGMAFGVPIVRSFTYELIQLMNARYLAWRMQGVSESSQGVPEGASVVESEVPDA